MTDEQPVTVLKPASSQGLRVPGTWWRWFTSIMLACPTCAKVTLLAFHRIDLDGAVHPDWSCTAESCEFKGALRLEGWSGE